MDEETNLENFEEEEMGEIDGWYFSKLYLSECQASSEVENMEIFRGLERKVSEGMNADLMKYVKELEIREVVFAMGTDKSPGPDGLSGAFYQEYWEVVRNDICR